MNITAERYHYDPTRFRVTFELPKLPGQPRRRVCKVAPAGLGCEQALAWARRSEREVLQELLLGELGKLPEVSSRNQVLYKLRKLFERAVAWYILRDDQIPVIKTDKEGKKPDPVVYTEQQADRLLAAARAMGGEYSAIVLLLLHGGLRVSEIAALRWSDIDLDASLLTIQHNYSAGKDATPKGGVAAPVGLTPELARALTALPRCDEHVLVRHHKGALTHHTAHSVRYRLNQVQAQAGLPQTGPHLMRHSGLTILARKGCDPWRLQAHARHARIATTQRYVHLARETSAREAAAFWTSAPLAVPKTTPGA